MKLTRLWFLTVTLLLSLLGGCKRSHDISGAWFGTLDVGHLKTRLVFHIKKHGGGYEATIDTIDEGRKDISVTSVKAKGSAVHFELAAFGAMYDAKVNSTETEMTGVFRQAGSKIPFILTKTANPPVIAPPLVPALYTPRSGSALQGYWQGIITIGPVKTHLTFKIAELGKGEYRGELDSLDEGARGIPVTAISYQPPSVHMDVVGVAGAFDGKVTGDGEITGTWKQGPNTLPTVLTRGSPGSQDRHNAKPQLRNK